MGTSFKSQLLKAGLVNKKQVKKAKHERHANRNKNKGKNAPPETNKTLQEQLAKKKLNQERNQQLNQEKQKLENLKQVRQLIETNRLKLDDYDEPYYFVVDKKIKKLFVNEDMIKQLSLRQLAIVKLDDRFEIVPDRAAEQIAARDPDALVAGHKTEKQ